MSSFKGFSNIPPLNTQPKTKNLSPCMPAHQCCRTVLIPAAACSYSACDTTGTPSHDGAPCLPDPVAHHGRRPRPDNRFRAPPQCCSYLHHCCPPQKVNVEGYVGRGAFFCTSMRSDRDANVSNPLPPSAHPSAALLWQHSGPELPQMAIKSAKYRDWVQQRRSVLCQTVLICISGQVYPWGDSSGLIA